MLGGWLPVSVLLELFRYYVRPCICTLQQRHHIHQLKVGRSYLGLMYDALEELSDLSLALQRADINLPVANKLVSRQVEVFAARKTTESGFYKEACDAVEIGLFRGVQVVDTASNSKQREIPKAQFNQALADSIAARLLPNTEKQLCDTVKVVDASSFPPQ